MATATQVSPKLKSSFPVRATADGFRFSAKTRPVLLDLRSSNSFIITAICFAIFTDIVLYAVIVPVIPFALQNRIGFPEQDVQHWVSVLLAVYGAAYLAASPLAGFVADRMPSRRLPLLLGLVTLSAATLMLCLGRTIGILLAGRLLQGISAAVIWTVGLALLADTVGKRRIGQASGYVSLSMSLGLLTAPLLGGLVYERAGYYPVYYMAFALIFVDICLRLTLIEKKVAYKWQREDSLALSEHHATSDAVPINELIGERGGGQLHAQRQPRVVNASSSSSRAGARALMLLLSSRRLLAGLFCTIIDSTLMTAFDAVLPIQVNKLFGWSSVGGGLIFLALIIPSFVAPIIGYWTDKRGPRWPVTLGFLLAVTPLVLLRLVNHDGIRQIVLLCSLLAIISFSVANTLTPLLAEITQVLAHKEETHPGVFGGRGAYATAYGLFNMAYATGMLVGPLWGGLVANEAGWATMGWTLALLSLSAAVAAWFFTGGRDKVQAREGVEGDELSHTRLRAGPGNRALATAK